MRPLFAFLVVTFVRHVKGVNDDLFNYRGTNGNDYGPADWDKVACDNVNQCTGWPDKWKTAMGWELKRNSCQWCPEGTNRCSVHHQSPIDLERNRALNQTAMFKECIDRHWMKFEDGSCTWDNLVTKRAFSIERHALKMVQPLESLMGNVRLDCPSENGRRFGRIDFSKGFHDWFFLSHIDIKVPSEHSQEGVHYSAEVQMAHFYSLSKEECDCDNEMATLAIFLQAYDDSPDYPFLDRLICEWRKAEDRVRAECGLPSVVHYPGCFNIARGRTPSPQEGSSSPAFPSIRTDAPSTAPTSKRPPTPLPTLPTTPDPASIITFAPVVSPAFVTIPTMVPQLWNHSPPTRNPAASISPTPVVSPGIPTSVPQLWNRSITDVPTRTNVTQVPSPLSTNPALTQSPTRRNTTFNSTLAPSSAPMNRTTGPTSPTPGGGIMPSAGTTEPTGLGIPPNTPTEGQSPTVGNYTMAPAPPQSTNTRNLTKMPTIAQSIYTENATTMPTVVQSPTSTMPTTPTPMSGTMPSQNAGMARFLNSPDNSTHSQNSMSKLKHDTRHFRRSVNDVINDNNKLPRDDWQRITIEDVNFRPPDESHEDWAQWVEAYSAHGRGEATEDQRKLLEQDQLSFHNYQFLIDVRTEYYFRYSGTSTVPPCYAKFDGTRGRTNHWRVLKDPIRVSPRQIAELERLLRERIAPADDKRKACENDTAGRVDAKGHISVARPRMQFNEKHFMTFCECDDWPSKWPEDREWCAINQGDKLSRLYQHPYNFFSEAFEV